MDEFVMPPFPGAPGDEGAVPVPRFLAPAEEPPARTFSDFQREVADALTLVLGVARALRTADERMSIEKRHELLDALIRRADELRNGLMPILTRL